MKMKRSLYIKTLNKLIKNNAKSIYQLNKVFYK